MYINYKNIIKYFYQQHILEKGHVLDFVLFFVFFVCFIM